MSRGRKEKPAPTLFVPARELYADIPRKHFYEQFDKVLDLSFPYEWTKPLYAEKMGRPSPDPVILTRCIAIGFSENIMYDTELGFRIGDSLMFRMCQ